jgi:hypothetical protein
MTWPRRTSRLARLVGTVLLGGCAYYNGMYNTNRMAKSARRAERDGRAFEAQGYWGQVITKADSLVVRHPRSKYADEATVLRGLAMSRLNQCQEAVGSLERLSMVKLSTDFTEEAALALGRCQLQLGDPGLADLAFVQVINSADPTRRGEARFRHARALRISGRYDEALALMRETPETRGRDDYLLALAGAGRTDEALVFADSVLALQDSAFAWDTVIAAVGRHDPQSASKLVSRLSDDPRASPEVRARRVYEDGLRLVDVDSAAAFARFQEAARMPGPTQSTELARLRLVRAALSASRSVEELVQHGDSLAPLATLPTSAGLEAAALQLELARVRTLGDSGRPGIPRGDLRLFLGAEAVRDSLHARAVAATLFRRLAVDWPVSPYAPKALLAAEQLDPADDDGTRTLLDSLYHDSPYLALVRGEEAPGYRVLEDSLQAFAAAQPVLSPRRPGAGARTRGASTAAPPPQGVPAEDLIRPRRPPPQAGRPVPAEDLRPRRGAPPSPAPAPAGENPPTQRPGLEP